MLNQKQKIKLTEDLSFIDNLDDLESEIRRVRAELAIDSRELKQGFQSIPVEGIRTVFGNAVPFFVKTTVASKTWNIVKTIVSLFLHTSKKTESKSAFAKDNLQDTLKQIGMLVGVTAIKSFLAKRKKKA